MGVETFGGEKIKKIARDGVKSRVKSLEVGFFAGATYSKGNIPVAAVALINEFGTSNGGAGRIPERPFFRNANSVLKQNYLKFLISKMERINGLLTLTVAVANLLGVYHEGLIKKSINDMISPPNAPSTIKAKKSDHPLIDTGYMLQSVTFKVNA